MVHSLSHREFVLLQKYIEEQSGIQLGEEKAYLIESRLSDILDSYSLSSYEQLFYRAQNKMDAGFCQRVIDAVTTNETYWFRDKTPWYILEDILLPVYIKEIREGKRADVRIWSCACSSGQEPYSIAMCIDSYLRKNSIENISLDRFHILATDLSKSIIDTAVEGKYDMVSMQRGLDRSTIDRYFVKEGNLWSICEKIRQAVNYRQFNLKGDNFTRLEYDIIFCRYVMIYFSEHLKERLLSRLINALRPQGVLFIGASEIINSYWADIEMETYKNGVYFRLKGGKERENSFGRRFGHDQNDDQKGRGGHGL